jgi:hypothetical protein
VQEANGFDFTKEQLNRLVVAMDGTSIVQVSFDEHLSDLLVDHNDGTFKLAMNSEMRLNRKCYQKYMEVCPLCAQLLLLLLLLLLLSHPALSSYSPTKAPSNPNSGNC